MNLTRYGQAIRLEPKVSSVTEASERMRRAIDSVHGRNLYSMVHNIEKLAR